MRAPPEGVECALTRGWDAQLKGSWMRIPWQEQFVAVHSSHTRLTYILNGKEAEMARNFFNFFTYLQEFYIYFVVSFVLTVEGLTMSPSMYI